MTGVLILGYSASLSDYFFCFHVIIQLCTSSIQSQRLPGLRHYSIHSVTFAWLFVLHERLQRLFQRWRRMESKVTKQHDSSTTSTTTRKVTFARTGTMLLISPSRALPMPQRLLGSPNGSRNTSPIPPSRLSPAIPVTITLGEPALPRKQQSTTTGVYFNNVELREAMHPLQGKMKRSMKKRKALSFGKPLCPAPMLPRTILQPGGSWGCTMRDAKTSSSSSLFTDNLAPQQPKDTQPVAKHPGSPTARPVKKSKTLTPEEVLFIEATAQLKSPPRSPQPRSPQPQSPQLVR